MYRHEIILRMLAVLAIVTHSCVSWSADPVPFSKQVAWLSEAQQPPAEIPTPWRPLSNLLQDEQARPLTTLAEWRKQREHLREAWQTALGPMPERPKDASFKVLKRDVEAGVIRELIDYEGEPGLRVQGYLLRPLSETFPRSRPAIVALHPTTNLTIEAIAGVRGDVREHSGVALAKAGFVVFCPRCFLWQDAKDLNAAVAKHRERHPQTTGMAKMLYDAMRAVDIVAGVAEVDSTRIGAFGHSLGAKETLYLMAFDDRVRAGVASEGGIGLDSTNWDAPWYLGPQARDKDWARNHHELIALIAPRALLVIGGEKGSGAADGRRTWPYLAAALPVYRLYHETAPLAMLNHGQGHPLPEKEFKQGVEWLETYLSATQDRDR